MKQTEVGLIPDDWEVVKLSDIANFRRGTFPQPYGLPQWYGGPGNYPFVQVADLSDNKFILNNTTNQTISKLAQERSLFVPKGSVIVTLQGTIGRVAITQYDCYMDRTLAVFESFKRNVCKAYFALALHDKFQIEAKLAPGGIIKTITKEVFSDFNIVLPPLNEQKKIAEALSDIDSLICGIEEEIEKKKNIKTGAMQELLTGKRRLPGFAKSDKTKMTELGEIPEDWDVKSLGEIGSFKNGISKDESYFGHGSPFVNLLDVFGKNFINSNKKLGLIDSNESEQNMYSLQQGDILFVRSSVKPEGVGLTTVLMEDLKSTVYSGFLLRFRERLNLLDLNFKKYAFDAKYFRNNLIASSTVSANTNINQPSLRKLLLILPTKEEQAAIAAILTDVDEEIKELESKLLKYKKVKDGMMQQLLTGKIRLN